MCLSADNNNNNNNNNVGSGSTVINNNVNNNYGGNCGGGGGRDPCSCHAPVQACGDAKHARSRSDTDPRQQPGSSSNLAGLKPCIVPHFHRMLMPAGHLTPCGGCITADAAGTTVQAANPAEEPITLGKGAIAAGY